MPTFTVRPGIYLTPQGDPMTATKAWHRDGVAIPGENADSYTTTSPDDDNKLIEYVERAGNNAGLATEQRLTLQAATDYGSLNVAAYVENAYGAVYDPSDLSTLWQDAAGTVAVTTDGDPVRRMDDKSGNGHHAIAPSDAARPAYRTSGGLHWLEFDGSAEYLVVTAPAFRLELLSFYIGLEEISFTNFGRILSFASSSPDDWYHADAMMFAFGTSSILLQVLANSEDVNLNHHGVGSVPASAVDLIKTAGGATLRLDNASVASETKSYSLSASHGGNLYIGTYDAITNLSNFKLFGLAIYSGHGLSGTNEANVRGWAAAKSGATLA